MNWLAILLGLADPIEKITTAIVKARADSLNATTEQDRIAAQEQIAELQARRDVMIAEASVSRANIWVRTFFAVPVIFVLWKLFIWDKALGDYTHGHTDPLSPELWRVIMLVISFYFLYEGAIGVSRIIKR